MERHGTNLSFGTSRQAAVSHLHRFCRPHGIGTGRSFGRVPGTFHGADRAPRVCLDASGFHRRGGVSFGIRNWSILFRIDGTPLDLGRSSARRPGSPNFHARFSPQTDSWSARNGARGSIRVDARRTATLPAVGCPETRGRSRRRRPSILHAGAGNSRAIARIAGRPAIPVARCLSGIELVTLFLAALDWLDQRKLELVLHRIHAVQQNGDGISDTELAPGSLPDDLAHVLLKHISIAG